MGSFLRAQSVAAWRTAPSDIFFYQNPLGVYSLGTRNKNLQYGEDGSLTLYMGATSPGTEKESNCLSAPEGTFSLMLRSYWPDQAVLDGAWLPPDVVKMN